MAWLVCQLIEDFGFVGDSVQRLKTLSLVALSIIAPALLSQQIQWVYPRAHGHLVYRSDKNGVTIPDYSFAGYHSGGVALPVVPAQINSPLMPEITHAKKNPRHATHCGKTSSLESRAHVIDRDRRGTSVPFRSTTRNSGKVRRRGPDARECASIVGNVVIDPKGTSGLQRLRIRKLSNTEVHTRTLWNRKLQAERG